MEYVGGLLLKWTLLPLNPWYQKIQIFNIVEWTFVDSYFFKK